jgi:molybdopterin molybdotransferase
MLLSPTEATAIITPHLPRLPAEDCNIGAAHGRILRRAIKTDRDMPAFDRVTMDGFAVNTDHLPANSTRTLRVIGFQAAGMMAQTLTEPGTAIEIATGAVLPIGANAIVPYEDTTRDGDTLSLSPDAPVQAGQNLHPRASDFAAGAELLTPGTRLTGREIAVAATCGAAHLTVSTRPAVAVISTGDELVDIDTPQVAAHQIRKSNDHALRAALLQTGLTGRIERFHLRDNRPEIESSLRHILSEFDVVVLTGGVSKGKLDFLPEVLAELNVTQHFRGIAQRPGKPLWFGTTSRRTPVFALPGNPVSTYTCLHRYVIPALRHMAQATPQPIETARLAADFACHRPLAFMLPVQIDASRDGQLSARPAPFNTSGDLGGLLHTDGFLELPAHQNHFPAGTIAQFWRWI